MATKSFTVLRRLAGVVFTLMLLSLYLPGAAIGQAPPVTATSPAGLVHPALWGDSAGANNPVINQSVTDPNGDWLVVPAGQDGGLFEFPASGGPMMTLVPLKALTAGYNPEAPMILLDPDSNLYLTGGYTNCVLEFPYNAVTNSWPTVLGYTAANPLPSACVNGTPPSWAQYGLFGSLPGSENNYIQPWAAAIGQGPIANQMVIGTQDGNGIFILPVNGAWSNPTAPSGQVSGYVLYGATGRPISIAVDPQGNIFFVEDYNSGSFLPGVYEIPAGTTGLTSDCPVYGNGLTKPATGSSCLTRVDNNLPDVTGVISDAAGNLYVSDGQQGVFMIPNPSGTPETSQQVMLSPVPAQGEVAIDPARKILYLGTTQVQKAALTTTVPYALQSFTLGDVAKVGINYAEFGASPVGTTTVTSLPVNFSFNTAETPDRVIVMENGQSSNDFAISSEGCAMQTAYAANSSCSLNLTMTPHAVGNVSAELLLQRSDAVGSSAPDCGRN